MKTLLYSTLTTAGLLSGCASSLVVTDAEQKAVAGLPVRTPALVKITKTTDYKVLPGVEHQKFKEYCTPEVSEDFQTLPLGTLYFISFKPAALADAEFKVEFADSGALKHVSLNSKASSGVEQVSGLLSTVLPFVKAPKGEVDAKDTKAAGDKTSASLRAEHCSAGKTTAEISPAELPGPKK